jgi:hypothetical protein
LPNVFSGIASGALKRLCGHFGGVVGVGQCKNLGVAGTTRGGHAHVAHTKKGRCTKGKTALTKTDRFICRAWVVNLRVVGAAWYSSQMQQTANNKQHTTNLLTISIVKRPPPHRQQHQQQHQQHASPEHSFHVQNEIPNYCTALKTFHLDIWLAVFGGVFGVVEGFEMRGFRGVWHYTRT